MFRVILVAAILRPGTVLAQEPKPAAPSPQHEFLTRFVGEWDGEVEAFLDAGKPPVKSKSTMTGRMIGNFWVVLEVQGDAFGQPYQGHGTFGFDSAKTKKYIGTWADSMSNFMWKYEGTVEGNKLVFHSEGPDPSTPGKMIKAVDTWEFKGKDQVILTGQMEGPDGKIFTMVKVTCTRKKNSRDVSALRQRRLQTGDGVLSLRVRRRVDDDDRRRVASERSPVPRTPSWFMPAG